MKKAYGYPLSPDHDNCFGIVVDEFGNFLGTHTSSNYSFLANDLKSHAKGYDYEFVNYQQGPGFTIPVLLNEIYRLKDELGEVKKKLALAKEHMAYGLSREDFQKAFNEIGE